MLRNSSQTGDFDGDLLAPLRPKALWFARTYKLARNEEQALEQYEIAKTQIEERLAEEAAAGELTEKTVLLRIALAETQAALGQADEARASALYAEQLTDPLRRSEARLDLTFGVWLPLGDDETALAELRDYLSSPGFWSFEALRLDPRLAPLADDPRFTPAALEQPLD